MAKKVIQFKNKLSYFLNLIDIRQKECDLWGVLDATKNAMKYAKTKIDKDGLNLLMGQVYFDMQQYILSCEYFFRAVRIPYLRASCFFGVARNLVKMHKYNLALDYLEGTLKWDTNNKFTDAVLAWTQVIREEMGDVSVGSKKLLHSAKYFMVQQQYEQALQILQILKSDEETQSYLALCNLLLEDYSTAERMAKEVLAYSKNNILALSVMVEVCEHKSNLLGQKKYMQQLYLYDDNIKEELLRIVLLFAKYKEWDKVYMFCERLIKIDEFNATNYLYFALCCYNQGKQDEALYNISRARWLDEDNPIYLFFLELIQTHELPLNIPLKNKLPTEIEQRKVNNLVQIFYGGKFATLVNKSYLLLEDIEWSFSLQDCELTNMATKALCNCDNNKCEQLIQKILLSPKLNAKQKFYITRNALLANKIFEINFVCNLRYSSFTIGKNELQKIKAYNMREGICSALSYVECFYPTQMLVEKISHKSNKIKNNELIQNISSEMIACILLYDYPNIYKSACMFFNIDENIATNFAEQLNQHK